MGTKTILAIDPGPVQSAYVLIHDDYSLCEFGKIDDNGLLKKVLDNGYDELVIEMISSYGMAVGKDVFETCVWIGRYWQASPCAVKSVLYRKEEKMNLCGTMKANDSTIRHSLIERFAKHDFKNGKGTKNDPDFFYGFKDDIWAAMAVGVTYLDRRKEHDV